MPSHAKDGAATVRGSDAEPPEGEWDSADTVTSFPDPNALPEPSRDVPPVKVTEASPASMTSPSFTAPTARTAAQAIAAAQPPAREAPAPATQAPATQAQTQPLPPVAPVAPVAPAKMGGNQAIAGLGSAMREEVWAIVRAAVNEATAPLIARNRELEARVDRAEKEIVARTAAPGARGATAPMQATPAPPAVAAGGSAASKLASLGSSSIPITATASVAPVAPPAASLAPQLDASATRPEIRIEAPKVLPGPRGSIPPQGLGLPVMTMTRPTLDLESVGAVDVSEFDGGKKKKMVARVFVVVLLAIVTACVVAMIASRS